MDTQEFLYPIELADAEPDQVQWLQAMPVGTYDHPVYGKIDLTPERLTKFAANVKAGVRGQELDIDYDHKVKTDEAAGWVKDAEVRQDGLWIAVEWTKTAAGKIKEKAYRYFSPEFTNKWKHPKTGTTHTDVLFGGALTNRPFLKDIKPIQMFSELGGNELDILEQLRTALGLPADATAEAVLAKVTDKPTEHAVPVADAQLSENVAKLMADNQTLAQQLQEVQASARLAETSLKLTELNTGKKVAFSPVVLDEAKALAAELPKAHSDKLFSFMEKVLTDGIVKLGELAGGEHTPAESGDDAVKRFTDAISKLMETDKLDYVDASKMVAATDPELYSEYCSATYIKAGA